MDTVERFQGSERETIILCLPLRFAGNLKQIESLSDDGSVDRKLNVALSRAKQRIIILGNLSLCRASEHYRRIIQDIENHGIIVDSTSAMKELTKPD
ncbi:MAG: AAA domain-containing protein [Candidatus Cloacimonetes bacterium]|nr:AAA domain-containing protein [Candidatus Cloacimonadota bacterium]